MNILFLIPVIHDLPTGGNIYNRRIIEAMKGIGGIHVSQEKSRHGEPIHSLENIDVVVVDSLLVGLERPAGFKGCWVLLVHYLTICDPSVSEVEKRRLERDRLDSYDGFITTSHYSKNCLVKAGIREEQVSVVYPGLDEVYQDVDMPALQSADACKLLTVASILPGKGLEECLDVLELLEDTVWTWDIVGEGTLNPDYTQFFIQRLASSPVSNRVFWEGRQAEQDMPWLYRSHDLLVVSSAFETLGMSIREAMASGLPVIAYEVGGIAESLLGGGGILVDPFHTERMRDELRRLILSPEERSAIGEKGLQQSRHFSDWEDAGRSFVEALNRF